MATIKEYTKGNKKYYQFQVYVGTDPATGKKRQTTRRGFKTKKQAQTALRKLQIEISEGTFEKKSYETYQDYYDLWIDQYRKSGVRESTYIRTTNMFKNRILPLFGHMRIKHISIHDCQKCVNKWFEEMSSYRKVKGYASTIFTYAMTLDAIQKNPMDLVTMPMKILKPNQEENKNFYTKDQVLHFLDCVKSENNLMIYSFFRILVFSGCRQGEALALTWSDIEFKNGKIRIRKSLSRGLEGLVVNATKTINSMREISIDSETLAILKKWKIQQQKELRILGTKPKKDQLLFSSATNDLLQNTRPRKWLVKILMKYDLPQITIHGFRHTHATLLLESGAQLIDIKDKLGHSSIKTTGDIYAHVTEQRKDETAAMFEAHLSDLKEKPKIV